MAEGIQLLELEEPAILKYLLTVSKPEWDILLSHRSFAERWVLLFLKRSRPMPKDALLEIYQHKLFRKSYQIRLWLVRCKCASPAVSMNLVHTLRWVDLLQSLRQPYLPGAVQHRIVSQLLEAMPRLALGEKVTLARHAPRVLIKQLCLSPERMVIKTLLLNYFFTYEDLMFLINYPKTEPSALEEVVACKKWARYKEVRICLLKNERTPRALIFPLAKSLGDHELRSVLRDPRLTLFARRLIHRILEERFNALMEQRQQHLEKTSEPETPAQPDPGEVAVDP